MPSFRAPILLVAGLALAAPAFAQQTDLRALTDRIERLQRDVDVLQRRLAVGGAPPPASSASGISSPPSSASGEGFVGQSEARFGTLEGQQRDLTGRLEEIGFKLQQLETRLDKLVGDVDFRLTQLEGGKPGTPSQQGAASPPGAASNPGAAGAPAAGSDQRRLVLVPSGTSAQAQQGQQAAAPGAARPAPAAAQPVSLPTGSPEAQYEFAYGILLQAQRDQTDMGRAEQAMKAFVEKNPNHRLAGNAQYWLGETFYVRKDYGNAALAYGEGVKRYPNAERSPDTMLKFAMSLGQLNRRPDACGALAAFEQRYPNAAATLKQQATRERQRLTC